jgi:hypothetical protein
MVCVGEENSFMDLNERLQWLQKAEGCLFNYQASIKSFITQKLSPFSSSASQEDSVTEETVALLNKFKDYCLVLLELREAAIANMEKKKGTIVVD